MDIKPIETSALTPSTMSIVETDHSETKFAALALTKISLSAGIKFDSHFPPTPVWQLVIIVSEPFASTKSTVAPEIGVSEAESWSNTKTSTLPSPCTRINSRTALSPAIIVISSDFPLVISSSSTALAKYVPGARFVKV